MAKAKPSIHHDRDQERFLAALSYIWIACLYTLLFRSRNSAFIKFHAKQGLALFVLECLSPFFLVLMPVVVIICVLASIWGVKSSLEGKYWVLPFIGKWLQNTDV